MYVWFELCVHMPYPAARTLPSVEKALQIPLVRGAVACGDLSSMLQKRTSLQDTKNVLHERQYSHREKKEPGRLP